MIMIRTQRRAGEWRRSAFGVFAVGDVRAGSVKRVDGTTGEGAAAVAQLHTVLADLRRGVPATGVAPR
jgi:thioredoxin reductase